MIEFPKKKRIEVNLIPMINIIFLLLIFFMLTGTVKMQNNPKVDNPLSYFASKPEDFEKNSINITISKSGEYFLENKLISIDSLSQEIVQRNQNSKFILDIDKSAKVKKLNRIIKLLQEKKINKVFIKTKTYDDSISN